jgi:TruD family tRNA pseudouridine synthase
MFLMTSQDIIIEKEKELLEKLRLENPQDFEEKSILEDNALLKKFGMAFKDKESLPIAEIKCLPSDFIVEEISEPILEAEDGKHITFDLIKCGISTIEFAQIISRELKINLSDITYAGIKDKKAITFQTISIKNNPEIFEKVKNLKSKLFIIKNLRRTKTPILMSGLKANKFTILARTENMLAELENKLKEKIEITKTEGFKNYYYLQRFGTPRLLAANFGYLILKGEFEKLIKTILFKETESEANYFKNLRQEAEKKFPNWQEIKKDYGNFTTILITENKILDYLIENPNDFIGAIKNVSDQAQIWVYALFSLLFNYKISQENTAEKTPLCLTTDFSIQKEYEKLLKEINLYPLKFENLKKVLNISLGKRYVDTFIKPSEFKLTVKENVGIVFEFVLPKGAYATTMLSNFINIIFTNKEKSGRESINIKGQDFEEVFNAFKENF